MNSTRIYLPAQKCYDRKNRASAPSFHTVAASNNKDHTSCSLYYC